MRTFITPDLHGRYELALALLREAEIVDARGTRVDREVRTVQLGDLANCVGADRDGDLRLLRKARAWFDVLLVGNHEHPYWNGPRFSGFVWLAEVERAIRNLHWQPALAIGGTLITHAGLHPDFGLAKMADAEEELRAAWHYDPGEHRYFAQIGPSRRGLSIEMARKFSLPLYGGVLWRDADEQIDDHFNQVFGHTVDLDGPILTEHPNGRWALNLDCGGHRDVRRIAGVWLDEHGQIECYVEHHAD